MRKAIARSVLCLALGLLYNTSASVGYAADELLAKTELNRAGEKVIAELWATPIKGGYMNDMTVIFKRPDESVITAYKPTIAGGYNSLLKPVNVIDKDASEQLLLSIGQGTWTAPSGFLILDYDKKGTVTEVFSGKENLGLITNVELQEKNISVTLKNGKKNEVKLAGLLDSIDKKRINFDGIYSLVPYDYDKDGVAELFLDQTIKARHNLLADVGYMLKYNRESKTWNESMVTIMANGLTAKTGTVNDGYALADGIFLPRKIVLPFGEGTYPEYAGTGAEAENKVNDVLKETVSAYLSKVFDGSEDLAFDVIRADTKLWTVKFINGKRNFAHHYINIDPQSHNVVKLENILDLKDKKLIPTLKKMSEDASMDFKGTISDEWYIMKNNLCLIQKDEEGEEKTLTFALENLEDYIIDKKWVVEKPKEEPKPEKEKTAEEKFWDKLTGTDKKEEKSSEKSAQKAEEGSSKDKTK